MNWIEVKTPSRCCFVDITKRVQTAVKELGVASGAVQVFVSHTTAGITINECADPAVPSDILGRLEALVPESAGYRHMEGNSDAHIKTLLTGSSVMVPVDKGRLVLGTWQAIFFAEYDGPRNRKVCVNPL
ncbi:MAG: secondary thiamine-phosphate synthase enzyme YjbQ [Planctomycetota bacterium]|jgi:secondary thiamine-phosphate synthase enzyme